MKFKEGYKIVCIDNTNINDSINSKLKLNTIYTIKEIKPSMLMMIRTVDSIVLVEFPNIIFNDNRFESLERWLKIEKLKDAISKR
jgi:hypothetical protein